MVFFLNAFPTRPELLAVSGNCSQLAKQGSSMIALLYRSRVSGLQIKETPLRLYKWFFFLSCSFPLFLPSFPLFLLSLLSPLPSLCFTFFLTMLSCEAQTLRTERTPVKGAVFFQPSKAEHMQLQKPALRPQSRKVSTSLSWIKAGPLSALCPGMALPSPAGTPSF